jgi:hypothetical protein
MIFNGDIIGIWVAVGLTLAIYSFLYKDNPVYKLAEHIYVGMAAGYTVCLAYHNVIKPNLIAQIVEKHNYAVLIPAFLGLLMFSRFFQKISWVSRIPIAFVVGYGAGVSVPNSIQANFMRQSYATIAPFYTDAGWQSSVNTLIVVMGVVTVLFYFFFSIEQNKVQRSVSRVGIIYLMIFFGANFGYTVMGRVSLVIGRVQFLIKDWIIPLVSR